MKKTILIVDDEADIRFLFSTELEEDGYIVFTAENGKECFGVLSSQNVDLVLLDIKLKEESGINLLQDIKRDYPGVKTMMCTAYSAFQDDLSTWHADGYWVKSQDLDSLKVEIEKILNKRI